MTAFTSVAGASNWNNGASWTGGSGSNWPSSSADTATITAAANVTIPAGVTITCGAVAANAGTNTTTGRTTITIAGELDLAGNMTFAGVGTLAISVGGVLDLGGNTASTSAADHQFNCAGTSGSHCTVKSSTARGAISFGVAANPPCVQTLDYTDFSGLAASTFGRSHTSAPIQHAEHCTFTDCSMITIDGTSTAVNMGLSFRFNDIRAPHAAGDGIQFFYSAQALGTNTRRFDGNTFSGGANLGKIIISGGIALTSFAGNVIDRFLLHNANASTFTLAGNFWSNTVGDDQAFLFAGDPPPPLNGEYFYYDGGNHVFGNGIGGNLSALNSVHEVPQNLNASPTDVGMNWYLGGASNNNTHTIQNCIFLGAGTPLSYTGAASPTTTYSNNTSVMNNGQTTFPGAADFSFGIETEQTAALSGTLNYFNNLNVDLNTKPGGTTDFECAVSLRNAVGSQITSADFNGAAGYDNTGAYATTTIGYYQSRSNTTIPGVGTHDVQADPLFVNKNARLATWDTSLGGLGTAANAIASLLRLNGTGGAPVAGYTTAALITFVKAGLVPTNAAFKGTGQSGADIGALPVVPAVASVSFGLAVGIGIGLGISL